jgi:hypothetical protein
MPLESLMCASGLEEFRFALISHGKPRSAQCRLTRGRHILRNRFEKDLEITAQSEVVDGLPGTSAWPGGFHIAFGDPRKAILQKRVDFKAVELRSTTALNVRRPMAP